MTENLVLGWQSSSSGGDVKPPKRDVLAHRTVSIEKILRQEASERPECGPRYKTCSCYIEGRCDGIFSAFCGEYED